ncbi:MAG: pimeloyl-CoA dehydrogenase small subunit [Hyphomicrobiaceae bacterium]|nr:pimeloyl-CoA dehydrogenase small subunit [Hyphomicrobiaceae bacterium]
MDFDLSDDQRQIKDSVDRMLAAAYADLRTKDAAQKEPKGYSAANWATYAELGLLGIPFSEDHGGLGAGLTETMLVMEAIGRNGAIEPYLATVVLGGGVLRHAGTDAQKAALIPEVIEGKRTLALAQVERQSRFDLADVATRARPDNAGGYILDGEKMSVLGGDSADTLIVVARMHGGRRDRGDIGLFLVGGTAAGVSRKGYRTQDGARCADITFTDVKVGPEDVIVGKGGNGLAVLERVVDEAIAAVSSEAVGAMSSMHELTVDYLKTRKQFGVPIGSFQVLQHRSVDMFTALEQARSMAFYGTMMAGEESATERRKALSAVKVQIGRSAKFVGEQGIQLHGGIGMTMEYKAGHFFKRLTMIDMAFGNADHHLTLLAKQGGLIEAA